MVHDYGFAPNPFWGFCTLGVCAPNHQGIKLVEGDWILGNSSKDTGNRLIYAMQVSEALDFYDYFRDPRFKKKKPRFDRGWQEQSGDNIYFRDDAGEWSQVETLYHDDAKLRRKDLKFPTCSSARSFTTSAPQPNPFRFASGP